MIRILCNCRRVGDDVFKHPRYLSSQYSEDIMSLLRYSVTVIILAASVCAENAPAKTETKLDSKAVDKVKNVLKTANSTEVKKFVDALTFHGLYPEVVHDIPPDVLQVLYRSGIGKLEPGAVIPPSQAKDMPEIKWKAEPGKYYFLSMTDPDSPNRKNATRREWVHWMVGNIPGGNITKGYTIARHVGPGPAKEGGEHRYMFQMFQQQKKIDFGNTTSRTRGRFSTSRLMRDFGLIPVAMNFFRSSWDRFLPDVDDFFPGEDDLLYW